MRRHTLILAITTLSGLLIAQNCAAQERISFPTVDGGLIYANLRGNGSRGVVLAHGARFDKESWDEQAQALAADGFRGAPVEGRSIVSFC